MQSAFQNSATTRISFPWFRAMSLAERIEALKLNPNTAQIDEQFRQKRLTEWRSQHPFENEDLFAARLKTQDLTEVDFAFILGLRDFDLTTTEQTGWQAVLSQILSEHLDETDQVMLPEILLEQAPQTRFIEALQPILRYARKQLYEHLAMLRRRYTTVPFEDETIEQLLWLNMPPQITNGAGRTLALELNVARLDGRLRSETPAARLAEYVESLSQPDQLLALLEEYPVLARNLAVVTDQWVRALVEMLDHLCADWQDICNQFFAGSDPGRLLGLHLGTGDRHRNGHTVNILYFANGTGLVYKPRSLAIDRHFQDLLHWFNNRGAAIPFRLLSLLDRETHGWVEFINHQPCTSVEELHRFYHRIGAFLALLHAVAAHDFHYENLIACGEHPVLIDLETLFIPQLRSYQSSHRLIEESVLNVGLLPMMQKVIGQNRAWDVSGLGMRSGQLTPDQMLVWQDTSSDQMHVSRAQLPLEAEAHVPFLNGAPANLLDFREDVAEGFTSFYQLLIEARDELMRDNGPLSQFASDEIRFVARPTVNYGRIRAESAHPDLMRDALRRDRFLDRLWVGLDHSPYLHAIAAHEHRDLWQFDIPIFTTTPTSLDLFASDGTQIAGFFAVSGMERVRSKLHTLGDEDHKRQMWLIQAAFASGTRIAHRPAERATYNPLLQPANQNSDNRAKLAEAAIRIGDRLLADAIPLDDHVLWLGLTYDVVASYYAVQPINESLYGGWTGVVLFLAQLGDLSGSPEYSRLARQMRDYLLNPENSELLRVNDKIGGFEGRGSMIYFLTYLGVLWNDHACLQAATEMALALDELISKDDNFDIILGAAGCIGSLLPLYQVTHNPGVLEVAVKCGDHLLAHAFETDGMLAWHNPTNPTTPRPLTGFSHGTAGIAWALIRLGEATGEKRFADAAAKALEYERSHFSSQVGNWADLRDFSVLGDMHNQQRHSCLWCHGAPGIGLARLATLDLLDNAVIRDEIDTALKTTLSHGFGHGHCLCHGDLGNVELLLQASQILGGDWHHQVNQIAAGVLESFDEHGYLCGNPLQLEEPGLMTGLAGIGYGLLRLAHPGQVPSILLLEIPKTTT